MVYLKVDLSQAATAYPKCSISAGPGEEGREATPFALVLDTDIVSPTTSIHFVPDVDGVKPWSQQHCGQVN